MKNFSKWIEYYEKSLVVNKIVFGENSVNVAAIFKTLGEICENREVYKKAIEHFE